MWWLFLLMLSAWLFWAMVRGGRRFALGSTVLLSFLFPCWVQLSVAGLSIDLRIASASLAVLAYCFHPRTQLRGPILYADLAMIALMAIHVVSDSENDGFQWSILLRAYGEWGLLYVAGRCAIQRPSDLTRLLPVACLVATALAVWSVFESLTHLNPADYFVGSRPVDIAGQVANRLGLRRAEGPVQHPIYFGLLQMLLFPWLLEAGRRARNSGGFGWRRASPWLGMAGIVGTMSRGPALGLVAILYFTGLLVAPRWRKGLLAAGVCALALAAARYETVLSGLYFWSGEANVKRNPQIVVDGQKVECNGTLHRLLIWKVYLRVMRRASFLGFGTERTTGFPVRVPFGPEDKTTLEFMRFVDNEYILMDLRFGMLGVCCLIALLLTADINFLQAARDGANECPLLCAGLAAAMIAAPLALLTVWLPHDFGALLLWTAGVGSGLRAGAAKSLSANRLEEGDSPISRRATALVSGSQNRDRPRSFSDRL